MSHPYDCKEGLHSWQDWDGDPVTKHQQLVKSWIRFPPTGMAINPLSHDKVLHTQYIPIIYSIQYTHDIPTSLGIHIPIPTISVLFPPGRLVAFQAPLLLLEDQSWMPALPHRSLAIFMGVFASQNDHQTIGNMTIHQHEHYIFVYIYIYMYKYKHK